MRILGNKGERIAIRHLKKHGYRILKHSYKTPAGEIDIIAMDGDTVVFVEVKTRSHHGVDSPHEAVNYKKQRRIAAAASLYLGKLEEIPPVRFDIIGIDVSGLIPKIDHLRDAFEGGSF